jgi:hypothetical protein
MALLDMQGMEPENRCHGHGGGGSELSLLLCASEASITLCL